MDATDAIPLAIYLSRGLLAPHPWTLTPCPDPDFIESPLHVPIGNRRSLR
jgi:hypothetical protein